MIRKEELYQIGYGDFEKILNNLTLSVEKYFNSVNQKIDLIVPILRSGAFTGIHLASKYKITNILPVQYKYIYHPKEKIIRKFSFPTLLFSLPTNPNILITDSNTVTAGIAKIVIKSISKKYPKANIYFASANLDYSMQQLNGVKKVFYGVFSNESHQLTSEQANKLGIDSKIIIFPWENLEEQWEEINSSQTQI